MKSTGFHRTILLNFIVTHQLDVRLYAQYRFRSPLHTFVTRNEVSKLAFEDEE